MALSAVGLLLIPGSAQAYQRPGRTERVSLSWVGNEVQGAFSIEPVVSANGRYVVFGSDASTLVPGDTNGTWDVFVRDRWISLTERVSVASDGSEANGSSSQSSNTYRPDISADGRYVAFVSEATNLVPGDSNGRADVFVHDRVSGKTEIVSVSTAGTPGNWGGTTPSISADGQLVVFSSSSSNLVSGDTNEVTDVFVRNLKTKSTALVSRGGGGTWGNASSHPAVIASDGRFVAFASAASNLVPGDDNLRADVFVRDLQTGALEVASVSSDETLSTGTSHIGGISADGRFVAFQSDGGNLVPGDTNGLAGAFAGTDIFVRDRVSGRTERVSVRSDGSQAATGVSLDPSISDDGRFVTFESEVTDLVSGDTNELVDVFAFDRLMGRIERLSVNSVGAQGNGHSVTATASGDGRWTAFSSDAGNLASGDTNGRRDVFVRDRGPDVGVGGLSAVQFDSFLGRKVTASGWSAFTGSVLAEEADPIDGTGGADDAGAELVGARIAYRAEQEDLLVRMDMNQLTPISTACGKGVPCPAAVGRPGILYGFSFSMPDATRFEVRGMRASSTSVPPSTPYFGLYRCQQATACVEMARLSGSIGEAGEDVRVSIPLSTFGVQEGASLRGMRVFTAVGEASTGAASGMDELLLGDADIPVRTVLLGVAAPNVPVHQVAFSTTASLDKGSFTGTMSAPSGSYRVWASACLGSVCSPTSVLVGEGP